MLENIGEWYAHTETVRLFRTDIEQWNYEFITEYKPRERRELRGDQIEDGEIS
jgi:hypothetical protein